LLGNEVRYDGGHRYNAAIMDSMGGLFEFIPFCPEVAIGLGVPRPTIQLVRSGGAIRVRGVEDPTQDVTDALVAYGHEIVQQLDAISGYIFKRGSPSCGIQGVDIFDSRTGGSVDTGAGMFADTIMHALPGLPVEDESQLVEPQQRDNFIKRVQDYHQARQA